MKMPVSGSAQDFAPNLHTLAGQPANGRAEDCTSVRQILARTLGRSRSEIADSQLLEDLIEDSLVREAVIIDFEDFLGREIDRNRFCKAKTVRELASMLAE